MKTSARRRSRESEVASKLHLDRDSLNRPRREQKAATTQKHRHQSLPASSTTTTHTISTSACPNALNFVTHLTPNNRKNNRLLPNHPYESSHNYETANRSRN
jgi:hypothetical protein